MPLPVSSVAVLLTKCEGSEKQFLHH